MTTHPPTMLAVEPRPGASRIRAWWLIALVLALCWDRACVLHVSTLDAAARQLIESKDWYRLLRIVGYFPTWLIIGIAFMLADGARRAANPTAATDPRRRGVLLMLGAGFSGLAAEIVKGIVGRVRPEDADKVAGWCWPISQRFGHWSDLSFPSSHAATAFGAAFILAWLFPSVRWLALLLAAGCGFTRILAGAHHVSDVVAAAGLAYAVSACVWRLDLRNNNGVGAAADGT